MSLARFLDLADFTAAEIRDLLALAERLQRHPEPQALAGRILGLVFLNPSLRTLASFQAGMARLGGTSFVITPGQGTWALETRLGVRMDGGAAEHIREGLPVLASYCDALGIRAFAEGKDLAADLADDDVLRPLAQRGHEQVEEGDAACLGGGYDGKAADAGDAA